MSRKNTFVFNIVLCLQILLAAYLVVLGIQGIENYNSTFNEFKRSIAGLFGKSTSPFYLIFAIMEIAAGAALLATLFIPAGMRIAFFFNLVVFLFWIIKIIIFNLIGGIAVTENQIAFKPDFLGWLTILIPDLIILTGIWLIFKKKR